MHPFIMAAAIIVAQFPGIVVRYLPFSEFISSKQKLRLFQLYFGWMLLEFFTLSYIYSTVDISLLLYKLSIIFSMIPYFLINVFVIKHRLFHHLFLLGMQAIYTFLLHTVATLLMLFFFTQSPTKQLLLLQSLFYFALFIITIFPLKNLLKSLFLSYHSIYDKYYWNTMWLLPILLYFSNTFLMLTDQWLQSWNHIISRLLFGCSFIVICKCIVLDLKTLQKRFDLAYSNELLSLQIHSLNEQAELMEDTQKKLNIIRHDMRHQLQLLHSLIQDGNKVAALSLIQELNLDLEQTNVLRFCKNPMINAALSVYIHKAETQRINVHYKVDIPPALFIHDNDLAIVLSNLLENALKASQHQAADNREIKIAARCHHNQLCIVIENRFDADIYFDKEGFPMTKVEGHGIGMRSLASFIDKYNATVIFEHINGWFQIYLYIPNCEEKEEISS